MIESSSVRSNIAAGIGTITFGHPRGNSLPGSLLRELAKTITQMGENDQAAVVVLQSEGDKAFCGGASFDEFLAAKNLTQSKDFFSGFSFVLNAMRLCPKFVIARVQGKVVGGGVGVAAAADFVIAVEAAALRLSELALGIGPFVIGPAVQRKIGLAAFTELAISADWRDAAWGRQNGLYTQLVPSLAELDVAVDKLARKLAAGNPEAMRRLKSVLWEGTENWDTLLPTRYGITAELALTKFVQDAISAVNQK